MIVMKDPDAKEKQTTLDDSASIYQKREKKSERQKFSEMNTFSEKVKYFKMYYLKSVLAAILIIGVVVSIIYTMVAPKDQYVLRVAFVDYPFTEIVTKPMEEEFLAESGLTLGDREVIDFDGTTYSLSSDYDYSASATLATHIMAGELDVFIAPESTFRSYAFNGTIGSLTELLPSDVYSALTDSFLYQQIKQEDEDISEASGEEYVLGIYLDETPFWEKYGSYSNSTERPVVGIVINSKHKENAITFLRYLFGLGNY